MNIRLLIISLAATSLALASTSTAGAASLITNGDFETGDFTGWTNPSSFASINSAAPIAGAFDAAIAASKTGEPAQGDKTKWEKTVIGSHVSIGTNATIHR